MTPPIIDQIKARMQEMYGVEAIGKWYDINSELCFGDDKILLASMLSDVQEMIRFGMNEEARQTLNRAKWLIREHLQGKERSYNNDATITTPQYEQQYDCSAELY